MKVKCSYCGNYLSDTEEKCPNCMAPNEHLKRVGNEVPQTIEELKNWYVEHNLPPEETTRFFIGKDIKDARAFGIYYDEHSGNYIVYKNKDTGQRAIRYEGKDEAYAVNELYLKLKEEILHQKDINRSTHYSRPVRTTKKRSNKVLFVLFCTYVVVFLIQIAALVGMGVLSLLFFKSPGYYEYLDQPYYLYNGCLTFNDVECEWYYYDTESNQWSLPDKVDSKKADYVGTEWNHHLGIDIQNELEDSTCYKEKHPPIPSTGYYNYNNQIYYYYNGWYIYNNDLWSQSSVPSTDVQIDPSQYYDSTSTTDDTYHFKDSSFYRSSSSSSSSSFNDDSSWSSSSSSSYDNDSSWSSSSSYDNDSSWSSSSNDDWDSGSSWGGSDSWDSGSTDWGSDW